jgi:hypothetical protein
VRDRDVRNAIQAALQATLAFDPGAVWLWGLPEVFGSVASFQAAVAIDPYDWRQDDRYDDLGGVVVSSEVYLTFLFRNNDPVLRDEGAERLLCVAQDALNGQCLAGLTWPATTKIVHGKWLPPAPPERRIQAVFCYQYLIDGWNNFDTAL